MELKQPTFGMDFNTFESFGFILQNIVVIYDFCQDFTTF